MLIFCVLNSVTKIFLFLAVCKWNPRCVLNGTPEKRCINKFSKIIVVRLT